MFPPLPSSCPERLPEARAAANPPRQLKITLTLRSISLQIESRRDGWESELSRLREDAVFRRCILLKRLGRVGVYEIRLPEDFRSTHPSAPHCMEAQTLTLSSRANPDGPYRSVAATRPHAIFFTENRTRCSDSKPRMGLPGKPRDPQFHLRAQRMCYG